MNAWKLPARDLFSPNVTATIGSPALTVVPTGQRGLVVPTIALLHGIVAGGFFTSSNAGQI